MKAKIFFIFTIFMIINSLVALAGNIETNKFFDDVAKNPLTNVQGLVFTCTDDVCTAPNGNAFFDQNSGSANSLIFEYPTTQNTQRYAKFFLAQCYLPLSFRTFSSGTGLTVSYDKFFEKGSNCKSLIDSFSVTNSVFPNQPVMIDVNAAFAPPKRAAPPSILRTVLL